MCPPPQLFSAHQTIFHLNDIKVFTFVMKVVFESCPRQCFQYMIFFLWYWVTSNFPNLKESDKEPVKVFHHYVKKYQAMMRDIDDDSLMKKLVDSAVCMFNEVGKNIIYYGSLKNFQFGISTTDNLLSFIFSVIFTNS